MVFLEVFGQFLPICWCCMVKFCYMNNIYCLFIRKNEFKILTSKFWTRFGPFLVPRSAVGTYGLAFVRPSVRPFVRSSVRPAEISKFVHKNFLFLAQSWGFLMWPKGLFRILAEKSRLAVLAYFCKKNAHFWPKINVSANFSKSSHRIFCIFKLYFGSIYEKTQWKFREKSGFGHFGPFLVKKWPFLAKNQRYGQFRKI